MKLKDAVSLFVWLSSENAEYGSCAGESMIKAVQAIIALKPFHKKIMDANSEAERMFMTERLQELMDKKRHGNPPSSQEESNEFNILFKEYHENINKAIDPLLETEADIKLNLLTTEEFKSVMKVNSSVFKGNSQTIIYELFVEK